MIIKKTITYNFGLDKGYGILDTSSINFPVKRNVFGQRKQIEVTIEYFRVNFNSVSSHLSVNQASLLKLKFLGTSTREGINIKNIHLTTYKNPYQIFINYDAILDCIDINEEQANLKFTIELSINGVPTKKEYNVTINLVKAKPNSDICFIPSENLNYVRDNLCIGCVTILNSCPYRYAEYAAVELTLKYPLQFNEDIISVGQKKEIIESNPYFETSPGLMSGIDHPTSCLHINRRNNQHIELRKVIAQNTISIPVYMNLNRVENPEGNEREEKFVISVHNFLNDDIDTKEFSVILKRDYTRTHLRVICNSIQIENQTKENCGHFNWIHHLPGKQDRFKGIADIVKISIANEATNKGISVDSAVIIKNLKIVPEYEANQIISTGSFLAQNALPAEITILKNGVDSEIGYNCSLVHKLINDIPHYQTNIRFLIDFDFVEDEEGTYNEATSSWEHYHGCAVIELEKDPGNEWLCVDYGTSATVAVFGDGKERNFNLLSLNKRNAEILSEIEVEKFKEPRFETSDFFLSSNIMLRSNVPSINSVTMEESLVYLSPSEPRFHSNGYRLPYIKALVGYKDVPNTKHYSAFKYKLNPTDTVELSFKDNPLEVDSIFRSTYRSLFHDYINECIPEDKEINKIILTIPNTYTPHHIEYLKKIVKEEIGTLRSDYIWFVSESDAIAYYYLKNWGEFNQEREDDYLEKEERVLVYDMGAGTLDVTYLSIEHLASGDKNVKMISKMGFNKAGNYLDYVLAEVLINIYPGKFPKEILQQTDDPTMQNLRGKLKFFIKNELKPKLFNEDEIIFSSWNEQTMLGVDFKDEVIDLKAIRIHEFIQSFISECTNQLFERFTHIGGLQEGESPIDTLIMTGRSIQFGDIKKRLQQKINIWNDDNHCYSLEIAGDNLKTVVSQGALNYAVLYGKRTSSVKLENKNIHAKYGILYVNRKNRWQYQPLIDAYTRPTGKAIKATAQQNGMQIFTYDTDRFSADDSTDYITLDMRNTIEAYLVQCYSPDPASDYEDEKICNDYISVMASFNPESVSQDTRNIHVRLVVDESNQMTFTSGFLTFETSAPIKIDVETNNTFKHSMWPYI